MTVNTPPPSLREKYGERYRWLLLISVMVGVMASIMSSTIVNVAIPDMSHYFGLGQERAQWVSSGFMVAMTVSMLTTPWLLSIWLAYKFVPVTAPGGVAAARDTGLDWRGLLIGTVGTLCLLNGLVALRGDSVVEAVVLLAGAIAALIAFIRFQRHLTATGGAPLMNMALFGYRQFAMGNIVAFIYGAALFGSTYLLPVYMQVALKLSASHVGTIMLPAGIVLAFTIAMVGRLADRKPTWLLVSIGLALLALSFSLMFTLSLGGTLWLLVAFATIGRIGLGFILPSLNLGSMRPLAKPLIPQGASAISFIRMLGGAAGVSLCAIALEWRLAAHGDSLERATSPARLAAFNEVFLMLAALCAIALLAAWQLRDTSSSTLTSTKAS